MEKIYILRFISRFSFYFQGFIPARIVGWYVDYSQGGYSSTLEYVSIVVRERCEKEGREETMTMGVELLLTNPWPSFSPSLPLSLFIPSLFYFLFSTEPFRTRIILGNENELKGELIESLAFARPTIEERTRFKGIRFYARNRRRPRINITTLSR